MPLHDIGFSKTQTYEYYMKGKNTPHSYITSAVTQLPVVATVWPGKAVFPDLMGNIGISLWQEGL